MRFCTLALLLSTNCQFVSAQSCPGICTGGDELLNPSDVVEINGAAGQCVAWDTEFKAITNATECAEKVQAATDGGCKCGTPTECPGIGTEEEELLNPNEVVEINGATGPCAAWDNQFKTVIDPDQCAENSQDAMEAGCKCGVPIDCPGICLEGDQLLNPGLLVTIDMATASCGVFDSRFKQEIDAEVCADNSADAVDAGCKCGAPIDCPGICSEGELLNADMLVRIDGVSATCGTFDANESSYKQEIDPDTCAENSQDAIDAGCKCGTPTECPGICFESALLNPVLLVTIDGTTATCSVFDAGFQQEIDPEVCAENAEDAIEAGCKCGTPIDCPGICDGGELSNPDSEVTIDGTTATCKNFEGIFGGETDPDVCAANSEAAMEAGCECDDSSTAASLTRIVFLLLGLFVVTLTISY